MPKLTAAEKGNRAPSLQGKMAACEGSSSPDHMRTSFNTAFHRRCIFCKANFELIKSLHFHRTPPSCTAHLCPSSHSLRPPSASRKLQDTPVSWRMPFLHPKPAKSPHLAQSNTFQLTIAFIGKKQTWQGADAPKHLPFVPSIT